MDDVGIVRYKLGFVCKYTIIYPLVYQSSVTASPCHADSAVPLCLLRRHFPRTAGESTFAKGG